MAETLEQVFAKKNRAYITAPAGCGKTELIANSVGCNTNGKQLILTHTHAGVKSLLEKLKEKGIPQQAYHVDTIAGFVLKYVKAYPALSGLSDFDITRIDWEAVYRAGSRIFSTKIGQTVVPITYSGLFVDEYQDCIDLQHDIIMKLADLLPCRIVGDRMQGIFDFEERPLVNWSTSIFPIFEEMESMKFPWRWKGKNEELGNWLLTVVRKNLYYGKAINLRNVPPDVRWFEYSRENQLQACRLIAKLFKEDSIVAIHKFGNQAHSLTRNLQGLYVSMEEVLCTDLMEWSGTFQLSTGCSRALKVIEFATKCMTQVATELKRIESKLNSRDLNFLPGSKYFEVAVGLRNVAETDNLLPVSQAMTIIEQKVNNRIIFRPELWYDMKRAIQEYETGKFTSLKESAWMIRDRGRHYGRRVGKKIVSRTLLVKGLEFDHSIVLCADDLSAKELYVAMTRGSRSLTILSKDPILQKEKPNFD